MEDFLFQFQDKKQFANGSQAKPGNKDNYSSITVNPECGSQISGHSTNKLLVKPLIQMMPANQIRGFKRRKPICSIIIQIIKQS